MSATKRFTPETAGKILIKLLEQIIDVNQDHCERISDDEGVTDHDNAMASGVVSRIDYDEHDKMFILTNKEVLRQDRTEDETGQDVEAWAMRFLNKHGEKVLSELLARHFLRLDNDGLMGISSQRRPDRRAPLPEISNPRRQAHT